MFRFPPLTRLLKLSLGILFGAYVLQLVAGNVAGVPLTQLLALNVPDPGLWTLWQVLTYPVAFPGHPISFLISLAFFYLMVGQHEQQLGTRRTLQLMAWVTVGSALAALAFIPFAGPGQILFGPHLIVWGTISSTGWLLRGRQIQLFGVIPMRGEHLIYTGIVLAVLVFLFDMNVVQLVASLAAIGIGVLFVRHLTRPIGGSLFKKKRKRKGTSRRSGFQVLRGGKDDDKPRWLN